jgi:exosortase
MGTDCARMETKENSLENSRPSLGEELGQWLQAFPAEFAACWRQLPNKAFFFTLLAAWLLLFQFYGNGTLGYINSNSLIYWMWFTYNNPMSHGEDGHGNLIPFVVLALFWWKRKELLSGPMRLWWPGMVLLAAASFLHVMGYMVQQPRISIVALFVGIYALMGLAWGFEWLKKSFFPFFLFAFCIPITSIGEQVTFPLRLFVTKIVAGVCGDFLGINVLREGTQLFDGSHKYQYEVAAACSGLQSLIAIFALSTIYAFVALEKGWKRGLMIAAALPLAILANVLRMTDIIIAAELYGQKGGDYVHNNWFFNTLPYVPAIIGVVVLGRWLQKRTVEPPASLSPKPA